jgi:hypothetical protein
MQPVKEVQKDKSLIDIYRQSLAIQDACNISGVLHTYWEIINSLKAINGGNGYAFYSCPAIILVHDKLNDLLHVPISERATAEEYSTAYDAVKSFLKSVGE